MSLFREKPHIDPLHDESLPRIPATFLLPTPEHLPRFPPLPFPTNPFILQPLYFSLQPGPNLYNSYRNWGRLPTPHSHFGNVLLATFPQPPFPAQKRRPPMTPTLWRSGSMAASPRRPHPEPRLARRGLLTLDRQGDFSRPHPLQPHFPAKPHQTRPKSPQNLPQNHPKTPPKPAKTPPKNAPPDPIPQSPDPLPPHVSRPVAFPTPFPYNAWLVFQK